ncbi:hypothetical protein ABZ863_18910 [Saccharomonospora sp. NPDC046836]
MRAVSAFDVGGVVLATFLAAVAGAARVTQPEARPVTAPGVPAP